MIPVEDYVLFQKHGMSKSFFIHRDNYPEFDRLMSNMIAVAQLDGYEVRCSDSILLRDRGGFLNMCIFSFEKNTKVKVNVVINVTKEDKQTYMFHSVQLICIKNYKGGSDYNFDQFVSEYEKHNLYKGYERDMQNGLIFSDINHIIKSFVILTKLLLLFK